jgi:hypothetical protein
MACRRLWPKHWQVSVMVVMVSQPGGVFSVQGKSRELGENWELTAVVGRGDAVVCRWSPSTLDDFFLN